MSSKGPKIITLDIETSPMLVWTWGLFDQNIGLNQVVKEWRILSFCWKELGKEKVHYMDCRSDPEDDSALLEALWTVLDEADIIIGQNLKKFDMRKINARLIMEGYLPPSPYKLIDVMLEARSVAAFTSNRLEWLSAYLADVPKDKHKEFPGFELWSECLKGNRKAWNAMKQYNPIDVIATEEVYMALRPWMKNHPNIAVYSESEDVVCPKCNSTHVRKRGTQTTNTCVYVRYHCQDCGSWSRSRFTQNTLEKRKSLLR